MRAERASMRVGRTEANVVGADVAAKPVPPSAGVFEKVGADLSIGHDAQTAFVGPSEPGRSPSWSAYDDLDLGAVDDPFEDDDVDDDDGDLDDDLDDDDEDDDDFALEDDAIDFARAHIGIVRR